MNKGFWPNANVLVVGGGSWGTVLANLISHNCADVKVWMRSDEQARQLNSTRSNQKYISDLVLNENIMAYSSWERIFETPVHAVIWVLPSKGCRENAKHISKYLSGEEVILHATKGVEAGTLKRISILLAEELPCARIGVISGPNLAKEIVMGQPAATVVASRFPEVCDVGTKLLSNPNFRVYPDDDVIGVEWAGTLKNILAIASGALDAMGLGWNSRSLLISRGLAEFVRFGVAMGGRESTFLGLAGIGDLLATASSSLSRNYRVGYELGQGKDLHQVLETIGQTAEGVKTAESVYAFAKERQIEMPICEAVNEIIQGHITPKEALSRLMLMPITQ